MAVDFLVLANSIKHGNRCLAGIVNPFSQNPVWCRLVSDANGGALANNLPILGKGILADLNPLDIVSVALGQAVPLNGQPENIILDTSDKIIYKRTVNKSNLNAFIQSPDDIWGTDSISELNHSGPSLMLLNVNNPQKNTTYKNYPSLSFDYNSIHYNIRCTVENFSYIIIPQNLKTCIICVSSGTVYKGSYYKFVAGVIF